MRVLIKFGVGGGGSYETTFHKVITLETVPRVGEYIDFNNDSDVPSESEVTIVAHKVKARGVSGPLVEVWLKDVRAEDADGRKEIETQLAAEGWKS